ncbi:hypothetical protein BRD17_01930 [Halobacteriales archaeon SW_7_68_16]|nr:MAG: hypothetical protein BRD17_01930 [Halobacteriales archaeon SW_7_68_16]
MRRVLLAVLTIVAVATGGVVAIDAQTTADRFEPNDDIETATEIDAGTHGNLSIHTDDDTDHYAVDVKPGTPINVSVVFDHSASDIDASLYGPDEQQVDAAISVTDNETLTATADDGGTYYVEVRSYLVGTAPYSLDVRTGTAGTSEASADADRFEGNDRVENATSIERGEYANLSIDGTDVDYYAVEASESDDLNVSLAFGHDAADVDLTLYGPNESVVAESDSVTDNETVNYTVESSGTHYVRVDTYGGGAARYEMTVGPIDQSGNPLPVGALPVLFAALIAFGLARRLR